MTLRRIRNLWNLSNIGSPVLLTSMDDKGKLVKASESVVQSIVKENKATVIPYKPRDPVAEIVSQLPENQKEV